MATALVSAGTGSSVAGFAWDSWTVLGVRALNKGDGHWLHNYQCGKERLISPGRARQPRTSCCSTQKSNMKVITSPSPLSQLQFTHYRYLNIFSGFTETWPGCGWQHYAFKKTQCTSYGSKRGWVVFFFNSKPQEVPLSISQCHFWTMSPPRLTTLMNWTY